MAVITRHNLEEVRLSRYREGNTNIYKFRAEMSILTVGSSEPIIIEPMNIKSIIINHEYDTNNMPMIFITVNIDKKIGDIIVKGQDTNTIAFKMEKCILNSDTPNLYTSYIDDEFIYFVSNDINKDDKVDYELGDEDRDDIYNNMIIGLMSKTILNTNKRSLNGVLNGTLSSCVYYVTGHRPLLMEPLEHNIQMKDTYLPPLNSVYKYLDHLNKIQAFYNTSYRFYMDFDVIYLLSSTGKMIQKQGEVITDILIKLVDAFHIPMDGMMIDMKEKLYYFEVDGNGTYLSDTHTVDKSYSDIRAVDTNGGSSNDKSTPNLSKYMSSKKNNIRVPNGNTTLLNNMASDLKNDAIQLSLSLNDIDPSVLTINKKLEIDASGVYKGSGISYSGRYIMSTRQEVYIREDENFAISVTLLLKKVS